MKTLVIAGCRCGSHTLQKTLEKMVLPLEEGIILDIINLLTKRI